jgi:hypothetical protein
MLSDKLLVDSGQTDWTDRELMINFQIDFILNLAPNNFPTFFLFFFSFQFL